MGVNHSPSRYLVSRVHKEKLRKARAHALSSQLEAVRLRFGSSPRKLKCRRAPGNGSIRHLWFESPELKREQLAYSTWISKAWGLPELGPNILTSVVSSAPLQALAHGRRAMRGQGGCASLPCSHQLPSAPLPVKQSPPFLSPASEEAAASHVSGSPHRLPSVSTFPGEPNPCTPFLLPENVEQFLFQARPRLTSTSPNFSLCLFLSWCWQLSCFYLLCSSKGQGETPCSSLFRTPDGR